MKYLKKFKQEADYQSFKGSDEFETPNVSYVTENNECYFEPYKELIVNKLKREPYVENYVTNYKFKWDYPLESDITVVYCTQAAPNIYSDSQTVVMPKGTQKWDGGSGNTVISITPSKDSTYIYTTDMPMYNPS